MTLKSLQSNLGLSDELLFFLEEIYKNQDGILLLGCPENSELITSFLIEAYPLIKMSRIERFIEDSKNLGLESALNNTQVIVSNDLDCTTIFLSLLEQYSNEADKLKVISKINGILILIPLKKQCGSCSKPTSIPSTSKERFPTMLASSIPSSYLFSRGCEKCGYSSYSNHTFLESFVRINNDIPKNSLLAVNPEEIFNTFRKVGCKVLFESGLDKIKLGITSIEEVIRVTPPLNSAFEKLLSGPSITESISKEKGKGTILIVEDDDDQREILRMVFNKEGYEVLVATNGSEAFNILTQNQISIIVSDIMMPVMNGLELVQKIKNDPNLSKTPVLMLTASSNPDHEVKLLEQGADDYCAKNVKKKVLITRVEKLLRKDNSINKISDFLAD